MLFVGVAGWSIPSALANEFPEDGSHLQRYASRFNAVEINSSFYRPHRRSTYERWASGDREVMMREVEVSRGEMAG